LYDDITGEELAQVHDYPMFSPNKKYIVYAQSQDAYEFSGIKIFDVKPHYVKMVYEAEKYGFDFVKWKEDESFVIKESKNYSSDNGKTKGKKIFLL
jgi:hypothetical protein